MNGTRPSCHRFTPIRMSTILFSLAWPTLRGLLRPAERNNDWQLGERASISTSDGVQQLMPTWFRARHEGWDRAFNTRSFRPRPSYSCNVDRFITDSRQAGGTRLLRHCGMFCRRPCHSEFGRLQQCLRHQECAAQELGLHELQEVLGRMDSRNIRAVER